LHEADCYQGLSFATLYLGGGTPSLLGAGGLHRLLAGLRQRFDLSHLVEATLEANPESVTPALLEAARATGIDRLSLGVQSLSDRELKKVGRIHNAGQAVRALELAQKSGFDKLSADVILGLPGQDWPSLQFTLDTLIGLPVRHLSLYCLAVEPDTPLALNLPADLPSDDEQARLYRRAVRLLREKGFLHYEISNFARPGDECRHNLNYWRGGEYLGLGPAAASHLNGRRFKNRADLTAYLTDPTGQVGEEEELGAVHKAAEEAVLRLRLLTEGLDTQPLAVKFGAENIAGLVARLNKLAAGRSLIRRRTVYRLKPGQALVCNPVLAELV
jgi:oxygen-independent coproporphyrinogen III oxidase